LDVASNPELSDCLKSESILLSLLTLAGGFMAPEVLTGVDIVAALEAEVETAAVTVDTETALDDEGGGIEEKVTVGADDIGAEVVVTVVVTAAMEAEDVVVGNIQAGGAGR
jgi:hypothetical protein